MSVKISIIEKNLFFAEGLKYALSEYFTLKGRTVDFLAEENSNATVDLVFIAQSDSGNAAYCDRDVHEAGISPLYIAIRKIKPAQATKENACSRELGVLDCRAGLEALFHLLDDKLWRMSVIGAAATPCFFCLSRRLSGREKEVVSYLRLGVNQTQAAKYMHLSVKTVHTYKQSVMRKLNFRKRNDLFNWLLRE
ncbi:helix-turn-helix transcriptional regulator [Serratia plymuthica]|uniref:LuxR family transcriptional regulator n=1 Tax=Serratia plymuthica S13 TaxID=1348660 RepID=S4YQ26_SERPL|nr:LuxR family transcriptional regulator [Serratia plymuthica]AGP47412.1 LuxR family transcriptional regulator [Serratia plymuthica S13]KYG17277.1 DNA-binding transcriptional activator EvgA [Serratia plymuthica]NIC28706.1 helix-turn-helix transcriptional regulator [Serratia plymuthica]QPS86255.1 helix-turn-helix transcriptional regulator [Serratia plymuthica]QQT83980.1 helix-turn-helix transcriptional regulator [Serratia plymuthica]